MTNSSILVIGGSGFIGSRLVARLARQGRRVIVPTRREARARHLRVMPAVEMVQADVHDEAVLERLMQNADAVINLVGILYSKRGKPGTPYGPDFARAHVELPRKIVAACAARGIRRFLHMSALGAARDAPSMYLRSKADGEAAAFSNPAVDTTVFRPSVVFGEDDHFLNLFATLQSFLPVMLLGAADARFQPVYVEDVVHAFVHALGDRDTIGKTIELTGPKIYTLQELVRLAGSYSGHSRPVIGLPSPIARLQALLFELMPGQPLMSRDNLDSMKIDNVASGQAYTIPGLPRTELEAVAMRYLARK